MNVKKWKNNKFIENLKIKQYPAYPAEFIVFLCVTLFRQKMAEKRYTICILLLLNNQRIFAVDGSKINLPHELINDGYKTPSDNAHYPQGLISESIRKIICYINK